MRCVLGADHGGLELKDELKAFLSEKEDVAVEDLGTYSSDSVDYPDFAEKVAKAILNGEADCGVLVCGTGVGISMKANRYKGIRAALVHSEFTAKMAKVHNNANVLCLGGRTTSVDQAKDFVRIWLEADFEGGRHEGRLAKLDL